MTQILLVLLLDWSATATSQVRDQLSSQWTTIANAEKRISEWTVEHRGERYSGNWIVRFSGWTYYLRGDEVRCTQQAKQYIQCGGRDFEAFRGIAIRVTREQPAITLDIMRMLHRAIFGKQAIAIDDRGRATIETIVSTPNAERRTSRRYRVHATLTAQSFSLEAPELVEEYAETCYPNHGCHSTHWFCQRVKR